MFTTSLTYSNSSPNQEEMSERGKPRPQRQRKRPAKLGPDVSGPQEKSFAGSVHDEASETGASGETNVAWWTDRTATRTPPPPLAPPASQSAGMSGMSSISPEQHDGLLQRINLLEQQLEKQNAHKKGQELDHLGITVPADLKLKIVAGKFVDLSLLLKKSFLENQEDKQQTFSIDSEGRLIAKDTKKAKSELSIQQWTDAFHTFMSVYVQTHQEEIQGMLAYMALIRGAAEANSGRGWSLYDQQFRSRKEAEPSRPWGMIDNQLWLQIFCQPLTKPTASATAPKNTKGECKFFNSKDGCYRRECRFTHKCGRCGSTTHSSLNCHAPNQLQKKKDQQPFRFGAKNLPRESRTQ